MAKKISVQAASIAGVSHIWEKVQHLGTVKQFTAQQIIELDDFSTSFFYIRSGVIRVAYIELSGLERTAVYGYAGSLFNVINVLLKSANNTLLTCIEDAEVIVFDGTLLDDKVFVAQYPELAINLFHTLAMHAEVHFQQIGNSSLVSTKTYLCRIFVDMVRNNTQNGLTVPHLTQMEMATLLGVNRSTLTRILIQLKHDGVIESFTKSRLVVLDFEQLCTLAQIE